MKPSKHTQWNPDITLTHVPLPQVFAWAHSSASEKVKNHNNNAELKREPHRLLKKYLIAPESYPHTVVQYDPMCNLGDTDIGMTHRY